MTKKQLEERLEALEKKVEIQLGLINHLNKVMSEKIINKIEFDIDTAVKKILSEDSEDSFNTDGKNSNNKVISVKMDGGLNERAKETGRQ
jgi:uncharacterized coiled-coil protein SlyX